MNDKATQAVDSGMEDLYLEGAKQIQILVDSMDAGPEKQAVSYWLICNSRAVTMQLAAIDRLEAKLKEQLAAPPWDGDTENQAATKLASVYRRIIRRLWESFPGRNPDVDFNDWLSNEVLAETKAEGGEDEPPRED